MPAVVILWSNVGVFCMHKCINSTRLYNINVLYLNGKLPLRVQPCKFCWDNSKVHDRHKCHWNLVGVLPPPQFLLQPLSSKILIVIERVHETRRDRHPHTHRMTAPQSAAHVWSYRNINTFGYLRGTMPIPTDGRRQYIHGWPWTSYFGLRTTHALARLSFAFRFREK